MKVLGLCSYPLESASTRYRLIQYVEPLADRGIQLTVVPFLGKSDFSSLYQFGNILGKMKRMLTLIGEKFLDSLKSRKYDAILIQREAMLFGPPIFEWLSKTIGKCPVILDLDDATYIKQISPTYGRLGSALKSAGKTDVLIKWSETVICGNPNIAEYVESKGGKTIIVPTIVDTNKLRPGEKSETKSAVIGWIGTHSTFPFLESLFPVFSDLAQKYDFTLKIVGAGKPEVVIKGVKVENLEWSLEREIEDFQSLDIGLYPLQTTDLVNEKWLMGKSGFKSIQYLSVGVPFVVTPIGVTEEIGIENKTHFAATTKEQWYESLAKLLESSDLRKQMGENGRKYALENYQLSHQSELIANALVSAVETFGRSK